LFVLVVMFGSSHLKMLCCKNGVVRECHGDERWENPYSGYIPRKEHRNSNTAMS
jgi:hypothetical protein